MSGNLDFVYDDLIANEKMKNGSKFERLAAVVFKSINYNDVVIHDLRLIGAGKKTPHQIDVTVQSPESTNDKRILIECKDLEDKVGLGIVRDFNSVVKHINPDEAIIVTTIGFTKGARTFAEDENIKLYVLREFEDIDLENRINEIVINLQFLNITKPSITFKFDELEIQRKPKTQKLEVNTDEILFYDKESKVIENAFEVMQPFLNSLPRDVDKPTEGFYNFPDERYMIVDDNLRRVKGFYYKFSTYITEQTVIVDQGNKIGALVIQAINDDLDKVIFKQDIEKYTFDQNGKVQRGDN